MMRQGWDYQQWSKFGSHSGQPGHRHGVQSNKPDETQDRNQETTGSQPKLILPKLVLPIALPQWRDAVREFSLPALAEIPATANLANSVFRRAAEQPQAVMMRRPGPGGSQGAGRT